MKKLMLLGGSRYLIPVIKAAHTLGLYVITCDYLPDNVAHAYSDEYLNISIIEKEMVLKAALEKRIDGIMSFACDPGVLTAAYVAEQMRLPFQCPYQSAVILQDKGLFRQFLTENDFNVPHAKRYTGKKEPFKELDFFTWPVIVKPVDSAGSKGVSKVENPDDLEEAIETALKASHNGAYIIEDFLMFEGFHSSADLFTVEGKLHFVTYSDQLFDKMACNPYVPSMIIWPSSMQEQYQNFLTKEIQRLMKLLHMETGIYNVESCIGVDSRPYIMEVSPRGGGCKIAELQKMAFGVDLIENEIRKAVGLPVGNIMQTECDGHWCEMVVHDKTGRSGIMEKIFIQPEIKEKYIKTIDISAREGDFIHPFTGANMSLGDIFLRFETRRELDIVMSEIDKWLTIDFKEIPEKGCARL